MNWYELSLILEHIDNVGWEQTRLIMHSIYQSQSTKRLKVTDILSLPDDNKSKNNTDEVDTSKLKTKEEAANLIKNINNGKTTT